MPDAGCRMWVGSAGGSAVRRSRTASRPLRGSRPTRSRCSGQPHRRLNRPGMSGDSVCWMSGPDGVAVEIVVGLFGLDGGEVVAGGVQTIFIVPVDPGQGGDLDIGQGLPRPVRLDDLGLEQAMPRS